MDFVGSGQRLTDQDLARASVAHGLSVSTIKGVLDVEAAGHGFDGRNRPKILPEPHVFYRELGPGSKRDAAVRAGCAYPRWGQTPYPRTSDLNYGRLAAMCRIDETAALRSTSWGLPQILGENHLAAGFKTPQAMVESFKTGEASQLAAFLRLINEWGLIDELKRRDAAGFARRYNGPDYERNDYPAKLRTAWSARDRERTTSNSAPVSGKELTTRPVPPPRVPDSARVAGVGGAIAVGMGAAITSGPGIFPWVVGATVIAIIVLAAIFIHKRRSR